jgi:DNA-binding NarL/FixJ family response regulator
MAGRKSRILIVDDHPVVRRGITSLVNEEPDLEVCATAASMTEAKERLERHEADLMVLDISLPDGSGVDLIKQVKSTHPELKILVSSVHDDMLYAERCLKAGALGYINKREAADEIIAAIRRVLSARVYVSSEMSERLLNRVVRGSAAEPTGSAVEVLSDRELEVFELIGTGAATGEIAEKLHLSTKTIETYRENIKTKMALKSGAELVRAAVAWVIENR